MADPASLTTADLLARLQSAWKGDDVRPIGDGWKTTVEWAAEWGVKRARAGQLLNIGVDKGIIEKEEGKVSGCRVHFYREAKP